MQQACLGEFMTGGKSCLTFAGLMVDLLLRGFAGFAGLFMQATNGHLKRGQYRW